VRRAINITFKKEKKGQKMPAAFVAFASWWLSGSEAGRVLQGGRFFQHDQHGATSHPAGDMSPEPVPAQQLPRSHHHQGPSGVTPVGHSAAERMASAPSQLFL